MKLKPCPFCGNNKIRLTDMYEMGDSWVAICDSCEVETTIHDCKKDALLTWNTRSDTDLQKAVELLKNVRVANKLIQRCSDIEMETVQMMLRASCEGIEQFLENKGGNK